VEDNSRQRSRKSNERAALGLMLLPIAALAAWQKARPDAGPTKMWVRVSPQPLSPREMGFGLDKRFEVVWGYSGARPQLWEERGQSEGVDLTVQTPGDVRALCVGRIFVTPILSYGDTYTRTVATRYRPERAV
jgi:hypothetical protein